MITKCVCGCGNVSVNHVGWYYVPQRNRGGRDAWMCPDCAGRGGFIDNDGNTPHGVSCGGGVGYRFILPVSTGSGALTAYMLKNGWGQFGGGYVSHPHKNLNSIKKQVATLFDMRAAGKWDGPRVMAVYVGPWAGYSPAEIERITKNAETLFGRPVSVTREGVCVMVSFNDATGVMNCLKAAKTMAMAVAKWLVNPSPSWAHKVRTAYNAATYSDGVTLDGNMPALPVAMPALTA